jgi:hypothetical protein
MVGLGAIIGDCGGVLLRSILGIFDIVETWQRILMILFR